MNTIPAELHFTQSVPLTAKFSRTLKDSEMAEIVPMDTPQPLHPADRLVIRACLAALAVLVVIFVCEGVWS